MLTELTPAEIRSVNGGTDPASTIIEGVKTVGTNLAHLANAIGSLFT